MIVFLQVYSLREKKNKCMVLTRSYCFLVEHVLKKL